MKTVWLSVGTALLFISQAAVAGQHSQRIQQNGITQPSQPSQPSQLHHRKHHNCHKLQKILHSN